MSEHHLLYKHVMEEKKNVDDGWWDQAESTIMGKMRDKHAKRNVKLKTGLPKWMTGTFGVGLSLGLATGMLAMGFIKNALARRK